MRSSHPSDAAQQLPPSGTLDPAKRLPFALAEHCFSFLPIPDLVHAHNVSHGWRRIFTRRLWRGAFFREADYEDAHLRRVRHIEHMAEEFDAAVECAREAAWERRLEESHCGCCCQDDECDSDHFDSEFSVSPSPSDFDEYAAEVDMTDINAEWHHLCLSHVRRENHRSKGYLTLRWGSHPVVDDMSFAAVDSSNNTLLLLDNGTPIDNDFDDPDPDELIWSLRAMDRSTLNYRYDDNLPPAKSYKMDVDRNAGVFLYRFRHTAATNQSPAMDWVELWIPHFHIHSFCPLQKEIGTLPDGVLHIAQCHEGICGFYPIAAINLAEVGATRATFHAHSTRYTDGTLRLWMSIGDKTSLLGGKPLPISSQGLMETFSVSQRNARLDVKSSTGPEVLFSLPSKGKIKPAATFYRFELNKAASPIFNGQKLASGTIKGNLSSVNNRHCCRTHQYLAKALVSGTKGFNKLMDPSTGVKSWDVKSFKYLQDADCLIAFLDDGYLLVIPTWTKVCTDQQSLSSTERDHLIRDKSILIHFKDKPPYTADNQYRTGFSGSRMFIYCRTITLIIDCSKIPPAATHGLPGSATVSSTNARTLEATIITDTERCLGDNHAILQDADSIYELVPSGCRSIEVNYKDAQALDPELPAYDDCRDDDGEPGRVLRVITFAKEPERKPF